MAVTEVAVELRRQADVLGGLAATEKDDYLRRAATNLRRRATEIERHLEPTVERPKVERTDTGPRWGLAVDERGFDGFLFIAGDDREFADRLAEDFETAATMAGLRLSFAPTMRGTIWKYFRIVHGSKKVVVALYRRIAAAAAGVPAAQAQNLKDHGVASLITAASNHDGDIAVVTADRVLLKTTPAHGRSTIVVTDLDPKSLETLEALVVPGSDPVRLVAQALSNELPSELGSGTEGQLPPGKYSS